MGPLLMWIGLSALAPTAAADAEMDPAATEARAVQRYREADRLKEQGHREQAAAVYWDAGQLFLAAAGPGEQGRTPGRLQRRALAALRRASVHLPAAWARLAALCEQFTGPGLASPRACDLPPEPAAALVPVEPPGSPPVTSPAASIDAVPVTAAPATFPIRLVFRAPHRGIEVQWLAVDPSPTQIVGASETWRLPAGLHSVRVGAPGFAARTLTVMVGPESAVVREIRLRRTPDVRARIAVSAALIGVGVPLIGIGAAVAVTGKRTLAEMERMLEPSIDPRSSGDYFTYAAQVRSAQFAVLGAGAGTLLAVPGAALGGTKIATAGAMVATVAVGVGAGLLARARHDLAAAIAEPRPSDRWLDRQFYADHRRADVAAATVLGAGVGLLVGSLTALVTKTGVQRRKRAVDVLATHGPGIKLSGRF